MECNCERVSNPPSAAAATAATAATAMCIVQRDDLCCATVCVEHDMSDTPAAAVCAATAAMQIAALH